MLAGVTTDSPTPSRKRSAKSCEKVLASDVPADTRLQARKLKAYGNLTP